MRCIGLYQLGKFSFALGQPHPVVDRTEETPAIDGELPMLLVDQREAQYRMVEGSGLRIMDNDVLLPHIDEALSIRRKPAESAPHDGDLFVGDELRHFLPKV